MEKIEVFKILIPALFGAIAGVLGAGGILQFLIKRHDEKTSEIKTLNEKVDKLAKKEDVDKIAREVDIIKKRFDEDRATNARIRILQFSDEIRHPVLTRSKESYDQILQDIDDYEEYCDKSPGYKNSKAVAAIGFIRDKYNEHLKDDSFLK